MNIWLPVIRGGSGTDVFTRRLADALKRRGISVEVTWFSSHYQMAPFLLRHVPPPSGARVIHANSWNGFAFQRRGIPLLVTEQLDVLHAPYRPYKSLAQHIYHETLIRRFIKASFRSASAITAVSHFTAASLTNSVGVHSVDVIYNWVDTEIFHPGKEVGSSGNQPFRLLFVGNLTRRKGADLLTLVMKELGPKFELRFTSGLRNLKIEGIAPNMIPLGRITNDSELVEAYNQCDALLFPSRLEGLPHAVLEAMACGKPVIATNISSLPEVVEDGVTGLLCPRDDIAAFVAACRKLAEHPHLSLVYGQAARRRIERRFSEEIIIPQYIALYEELAHGKESSA